MPPKPKFTREEIVAAALAVVSKQGADALTAREVAKELGCSTRPIFTVFKDMDELKEEVRQLAASRIQEVSEEALLCYHSFPQAERRAIEVALNDPEVYKLVFMRGSGPKSSFDAMLTDVEVSTKHYASLLQETYGLTCEQAVTLFRHGWIFTFGMGALCATRRYTFTQAELDRVLSTDFEAMLAYVKSDHATPLMPLGMPKEVVNE